MFNFWSETYRWKSKERYCKHREARSNNLSHPSFRHRVPVSDGRHGDHAPPEGVGVAVEVGLAPGSHGVLLTEVHEVAGEDEAEEADVEGGDQLLSVDVDHGPQQPPRAPLPVHVQHPQNLQEPDASHCRGCRHGTIITSDQDKNRGRDDNEI